MELKTIFAQDLSGRIMANPLVYVYQVGTQLPVSNITSENGQNLPNPFSGNSIGKITFALPGGEYDVRIVGNTRDYTNRVRFIDESTVADASKFVASTSEQRDIAFGKLGEVLDVVGSIEEFRDDLTDVRASVGQAKGSIAIADAVLNNNKAIEVSKANAAAAASLAEGYAASASSIVPLDLSGAISEALHRSPNAVTAMFVYDTSKDSDGGAWTEKCQHTSWYNEPINGKWLGAQVSELYARNVGAIYGPNLITNGDFSDDINGWSAVSPSIVSFDGIIDGRAKITVINNFSAGSGNGIRQTINTIVGKTYYVTAKIESLGSANIDIYVLNSAAVTSPITTKNGLIECIFVAALSSTEIRIGFNGNGEIIGDIGYIDNVSVTEVISQTTQSGDFYQQTTDGKFYRLWKNRIKYSDIRNYSIQGGTTTPSTWILANNSAGGLLTAINIVDEVAPDNSIGVMKISPLDGYVQNTQLNFTSTDSLYTIIQGYMSPSVISIFFKPAGCDILTLRLGNFSTSRTVYNFDTNNMVHNGLSFQSLSNGWYRAALINSSQVITITCRKSSGEAFNGIDGILVWGAQTEHGDLLTEYEATGSDANISEVFRGNKRDFPRLAGIVAEAASVTIYDLTEPGRPMWMRFVGSFLTNNTPLIYLESTGINGVALLQSELFITCIGTTQGYGGPNRINFAADWAGRISGSSIGLRSGGIARRNILESLEWRPLAGGSIASQRTYAVAMTVLPDAPVDPVTGLKVPTVWVATAGGVSRISHNGSVSNSSPLGWPDAVIRLVIIGQYIIRYGVGDGHYNYFQFQPVGVVSTAWDSWAPFNPYGNGSTSYGAVTRAAGKSAFATTTGVTLVKENPVSRIKGIQAIIRNQYNTGHMTGDIRRAYLADVDAGSVTGPELVTNGTFDTDTSGWTKAGNGVIEVVGGRLRITGGDGSSWTDAVQVISTVVGNSYRVYVDGYAGTANTPYRMSPGNAVQIGAGNVTTFTATAATTEIRLRAANNGGFTTGYVEFDNISIKEVVADRSYKAQGATINGTLTKSAVASAAQLVAYSGFSGSNYLREPYSADLDFGTGEWSVGAWVNVPVSLPAESFPVVGPELVTNGTFDTDTAWSKGGGWSIADGRATAVPSTGTPISQVVSSVVIGRCYAVSFEIISTSGGTLRFEPLGAPWTTYGSGSSGVKTLYVVATSQTIAINNYGGTTSVIDNVSIKEVSPAIIVARSHSAGPLVRLGIGPSGQLTATAFDGTTTRTVTTSAAYNTSTWLKVDANYTTDGTLSILVNGVEVAATRGNPLLSLNNSNAVLTIGNSFNLDAPFPGSIALLKLSATVPTAEQSVWMYEQEKQMFREGAQICLPDSGSIVDLAYDDASDTWIAASAANESEWSGLVRTNVTPVPAGSFTRLAATSGVRLRARSTTNPGIDVTIPPIKLKTELAKRAENASKLNSEVVTFDFDSITGQTDFILPVGYSAIAVRINGEKKREGTTKDFIRLFDGFKETIRFAIAPGNNVWVQIKATKSID